MLIGLYLAIVLALPLGVGTWMTIRRLPRSRRCPRCAGATFRIQSRTHALASRALPGCAVHRRWCSQCGWEGTARVDGWSATPAVAGTRGGPEPQPDRVDLRRIEVDGHAWRVMVECWAEGGRWLARLVFVAPGGQSWRGERTLEGSSPFEVLSRAMTLPERTLAGRLRRAVG